MAVREQEERSTGLNIQVSWETRAWVWREEDDMVELQKLDRWDRQMERRVSEHLPSETETPLIAAVTKGLLHSNQWCEHSKDSWKGFFMTHR